MIQRVVPDFSILPVVKGVPTALTGYEKHALEAFSMATLVWGEQKSKG